MIKQLVHLIGRKYVRTVCQREFESQSFKRWTERALEFRFVFEQLAELSGSATTVLDVGTGTTALPALIRSCGFVPTAIDNMRDYWNSEMLNRHWHVVDDDITKTGRRDNSFDVVTCISVLEHIKPHQKAVESMMRLLKPGGHLIVTCPYHEQEYSSNVYELPDSSIGPGLPYVAQSYSRKELDGWLAATGAQVKKQEFWQCWTGKLWTCGKPVLPARRTAADQPHQLTCLMMVKPPL